MRWFALVVTLLVVSPALAQNGPKGAPTMPPALSDYGQMPFSLLLPIAAPAGWTSDTQVWITAIWSRRANGAWYRNPASPNFDRSGGVFLSKIPDLGTASVSCVVEGLRFRCRDNIRNLNRYFECPRTVNFGQPLQWRSRFDGWPNNQLGWFEWTWLESSIWYANKDARNEMPVFAAFVSDRSISCQYRWPAVIDVWAGFRLPRF